MTDQHNIMTLEQRMGENAVFAFQVTVKNKPDWGMVINARSRGAAKSEYHRHVLDAWPDVPWNSLRCRKIGKPQTSESFISNAQYRAIPNLRCGDVISVGEAHGVVVGHDCSCNIEVLFDSNSPKYANLKLSVHPSGITL